MIDIKKGVGKIVSELHNYDDAVAETSEYFIKYSGKMNYGSYGMLKIAFHAKLAMIKKDLVKKNNRQPIVFPDDDMHDLVYFDQFTNYDIEKVLSKDEQDLFRKYFFSGMTINELSTLKKKSKSSIQRELAAIRKKMSNAKTIDRNFYMSFFNRHGKTSVTQEYDTKPSEPANTSWCTIGQKKSYSDSLAGKLFEKYKEGI